MLFQPAAFNKFGQRVLGQGFGMNIGIFFELQVRFYELIRENQITQPNGRGEDFAEGSQIDDPVGIQLIK